MLVTKDTVYTNKFYRGEPTSYSLVVYRVENCFDNNCWLWERGFNTDGYGRLRHKGQSHTVHQVAYQLRHGNIPANQEVDHICKTKLCWNPQHLEAVTHSTNMARFDYSTRIMPASLVTHCPMGHEYSTDNTRIVSSYKGSGVCRQCKECGRIRYMRKKNASYS